MLTPLEFVDQFNRINLFDHLSTDEYNVLQDKFKKLDTNSFTRLLPNERRDLENWMASHKFDLSQVLPIWILREVRNIIIYLKDWKNKPIYKLDDYKKFLTQLQLISHNQFAISDAKVQFFELDEASIATMGNPDSTALEISFRLNNRKYSDFTYFNEGKVGEGFAYYRLIDLANQALTKANVDGRFYQVLAQEEYDTGWPFTWAYIYLSYQQYKRIVQRQLLRFNVDQKYSWSSIRVSDVINDLKGLGLFSYLSSEELDSIQNNILHNESPSYSLILENLPEIVLHIDGEMIYEVSEDYTELVVETSKISGGTFNPENIQVTDADLVNPEF